MRILPPGLPALLLPALMLAGCSLLTAPPGEPVKKSTDSPPAARQQTVTPAPVKLYTRAAELASVPFRDLGEVTGDSCQISAQDPPPAIPIARRRMQINAAKMRANAVLQHRCEVISGTPGCYRQAVCIGSALTLNQ